MTRGPVIMGTATPQSHTALLRERRATGGQEEEEEEERMGTNKGGLHR